MIKNIQPISDSNPLDNSVVIFEKGQFDKITYLPAAITEMAKRDFELGLDLSVHNTPKTKYILQQIDISKAAAYQNLEQARSAAFTLHRYLASNKAKAVAITSGLDNLEIGAAYVEGFLLSDYQFLKYYTDKDKKSHSIEDVHICSTLCSADTLTEIKHTVDATCIARTLVNEPLSYLNAVQYSEDMAKYGKEAGFTVKTLHKEEIEKEGMGGLLGVNYGSVTPPTFNILEWKPTNAKNKKPVVLVGKGIVYDTGGLSLKPTPGSMDEMKCDMGGSAAVVGTMYGLAKRNIPVHVVALIPATDNRPGLNAYVPGDVLNMHDGTTVEVLNTDAEGRLVMADALSYAKRYEPELVMDLATLTGAAYMAIGTEGMVCMGTADEKTKKALIKSSFNVHERAVEFPLWDDYAEHLKSHIADIKNIGGRTGGAITAGKFLQHFTDYPWMHFDVVNAYLRSPRGYQGVEGTGAGVRLLLDFFSNYETA